MAVRTLSSWANCSRGKLINTLVLKATSSTLPYKGSMIKVAAGVATAIVEGEDNLFYAVTLTDPVADLTEDPTGATYKVTISKDFNARFFFAIDTDDTYSDYMLGVKVMIGDNCQTVKVATTQVTPGVYGFIGEVTGIWDQTNRSLPAYQWCKEFWDDVVSSADVTPVFNYQLVEIQITGSVG